MKYGIINLINIYQNLHSQDGILLYTQIRSKYFGLEPDHPTRLL